MDADQAAQDRYTQALTELNRLLIGLGTETSVPYWPTIEMMNALTARIETLVVRVDELEAAARDAGAGENTVDWAALDDDQRDRDDPAKAWTPEDEAAYQAETPPTLPHQP